MTARDSKSLYERATALAQEDESPSGREQVAALLESAVELGSGEAAAAIANWLRYGIHYKPDIAREIALIKFAASRGIATAHFTLGAYYEKGRGKHLAKSPKQAFRHYVEAALLGDADAYIEVALCYVHGIGTARDRQLARVWRSTGKRLGGKLAKRDAADE